MQARYAFIKFVGQGMSYVVGHVAVVRPRKRSCELQRPLGSETGTSRLSSKRWKRGTEPKIKKKNSEFRVFEFCQIFSKSFSRKKIPVSQYPMTTSETTWFCNSYCGSGQALKLSKASDSPSQKRVKERKNKKKRSIRFSAFKLVQADVRCALQRRSFR